MVLAGRDVDPPYERPYCSKDYLRGDVEREHTYLDLPDGLDLRIRTSVMKLDTEARTAKLPGEELSFDHAVLATGANVRRLRVDGADLEGIHYLRALGNADAIRADAAEASRVVLVGGSYIACEVAASLTAQGKACTLVMQEDGPLSLGFGQTASEFFAGVLRDHGIEWVARDSLAAVRGRRPRAARGHRVRPVARRRHGGDGHRRGAGRDAGQVGGAGARRDRRHRLLVGPGDLGRERVGGRRRVRVRLRGPRPPPADRALGDARAQGAAVAAAIMGSREPFAEVPYFWSDLADWCTLEYVGPAASWDEEVVRGSVATGSSRSSTATADGWWRR